MIDLTLFTATGDTRQYLNQPFQDNGHAIASDSCIAIVLFDQGEGLAEPDPSMVGKLFKILEGMDDRTIELDLSQARSAFKSHACTHCDGTGYLVSQECDECNGKGCFTHGSHSYSCKQCHARGSVVTPVEKGHIHATLCRGCFGNGKEPVIRTFEMGNVLYRFDERYLWLIQSLPNLKLLVNKNRLDHAKFVFDGGVGLLAACSR